MSSESMTVALGDAAEVIMGQSPDGEHYNQNGEGKPLITGAGQFGECYPQPTQYSRTGAKTSVTGDLIVCIRATIGDLNWSDREYYLGRGVAAIRPGSNLFPGYLWHVLKVSKEKLESRGTGSTFKQIRREDLASLEIPLPPLPEQRRIAAILDHAEALRAKRRQALAQLDALIQSIFLTLNNTESQAGWNRTSLSNAYWFQEGPGVRKWQFRSDGIKLLNVGNIEKDGSLNLNKTDKYLSREEVRSKYRHFLVDAGDLVIASSGISFDQDGMLRTRGAFVSEQHLPLCMNTSTIRFKAVEQISDLRFLLAWLDSREFREQITRFVTGSAQQNFGPSHLSRLTITLPPFEIQREFARRVSAVEKLKVKYQDSLFEMDALFASLQHRAFRGEL